MNAFSSTYQKLALLSNTTATLLFYQEIANLILYHTLPMSLG